MSTEETYTNLRVVRETDETRPCKLYIKSGSRKVIGSVYDGPERVAMFQLFAAAPEMLDFIKVFRQAKESGREDEAWLAELADRIIDKAEGGQP
jgi:hypothetical protein